MRIFTLLTWAAWLLPGPFALAQVRFAAPVSYPFNADAVRAITYDANRDEKPDILIAGGGAKTAVVLLSTATGFAAPQYYPTTGFCGAVSLGNANCDGYADLWLSDFGNGGRGPGYVLTLPGQADGAFGAAHSQTVYGNPQHVATADLNGDYLSDFVSLDKLSGTMSVSLHTTSVCAPAYEVGIDYNTLAGVVSADLTRLFDINNDGKIDALIENQANNAQNGLSVLLGTGSGTFGVATTYYTGAGFPSDVQVADLNKDGHPDLVVAYADASSIGVFLGQPAAPYLSAQVRYILPANARAVAIDDYDGDSKPDVAAILSSGDLVVLAGNGDGTVGTPLVVASKLPVSANMQLLAADFNPDFKKDLALISSGQVQILLNLTSPSSPLPVRLPTGPGAGPQLYPNPTTGTFSLGGAGHDVQVYDAVGRTVPATLLPDGQVQLNHSPLGLYYVKWTDADAQPQHAKLLVH